MIKWRMSSTNSILLIIGIFVLIAGFIMRRNDEIPTFVTAAIIFSATAVNWPQPIFLVFVGAFAGGGTLLLSAGRVPGGTMTYILSGVVVLLLLILACSRWLFRPKIAP